jgi:hypothetical protein
MRESEVNVDEFGRRQNVRHYLALLKRIADEPDRKTTPILLAEERQTQKDVASSSELKNEVIE